ncbi:hypothetical protein BH10BAC3_BH10BAC3_39170 [soil metagenome]
MKMEVIQSLQWLTERKLVTIYAYVIMPNHIHWMWTVNEKNGKESPQGSFLKFTGHRFRKLLSQTQPEILKLYEVSAANKAYEFWQRDSLAIPLYCRHSLNKRLFTFITILLLKIGGWLNILRHINFPLPRFMKMVLMNSEFLRM